MQRKVYVIKLKERYLTTGDTWNRNFKYARLYTRTDYCRRSLETYVRPKHGDHCYMNSCIVIEDDEK